VRVRQKQFDKNDVICASEISQFEYCSIGWYLQRCGYSPDSPSLDAGKKTHVNLGRTIDSIQEEMKRSKRYSLVGYFLFFVACFFIIFKVILSILL